jgi:L-threonylcarbamoyladenylate synthase
MGPVTPARATRMLGAHASDIVLAAQILRDGGLVAFPTETVYGLGADAFSWSAVARIFEAKGRPADDPLIVHVLDLEQAARVARLSALARELAEAFMPGPLTLVLPRLAVVPDVVTAGLDTVAVRMPAHPVALALLASAGLPIAAPSANLFSRPSPTRASHVLEDLGGRIDAIVDGGPSPVGVESTIVDLSEQEPRLLRPGGLAAEAIEAVLGQPLLPAVAAVAPRAPGMLATHYAPRTPLVLVAGPADAARARLAGELDQALAAGRRVGLLLLDEDHALRVPGIVAEPVGSSFEPDGVAARLFDGLRALDRAGLDVLFARDMADPTTGIGRALADRLRRAAQRVIRVDA